MLRSRGLAFFATIAKRLPLDGGATIGNTTLDSIFTLHSYVTDMGRPLAASLL
ncbi:hypothetical protein L195_g031650 [Trifolium pratense]|uniref:Uncharacterized protein n=1 Tax=Trifolium pratense TaxID=57577 RepID=A0A2K3K275_TRIPR|nr:hypothetical protein L195_g051907 [Trifolium pratense]PNX75709.1 hypothetical protein L195_g031650 [Trifolium pratense]